jgi:hypothetical protein
MRWPLLRFTKDHCRDDLTRMFGPIYIEKESQLPFIVDYVLLSATSSQQVSDTLKARLPGVKVTDKLLTDEKGVLQAMIEQDPGSLIVEHALPKICIQIDFEFERDELSVLFQEWRTYCIGRDCPHILKDLTNCFASKEALRADLAVI